MTKKILYVNGCSWTAGNGIQYDPLLNVATPSKGWPYTKTLNWGVVLANLIDRTCINEADGGGSNLRMVRTTCKFINSLDKNQYKETLMVLGWTTPDRSEIYVEENNIGQWCKYNSNQKFSEYSPPFSRQLIGEIDNLQKKHISYTYNYMTNYTLFFQQMFLMKNMLENLGIKYLSFHALPWYHYMQEFDIEEIFKNEIANLKSPFILDSTNHLNVMSGFCMSNNLPMAPDDHTMIAGHQLWAENLHHKLISLYGKNI